MTILLTGAGLGSSGPDPSTASAVVAGAGTATSNGTYTRNGSANGRPRYELDLNVLAWGGTSWFLNDAGLGGASYISTDDVAYPWLVTTWTVEDGSEPVPTVSIG